MNYCDLHLHILPGVDDGASSPEESRAMLERAYASGVRLLCATPHYHPGYFGNKQKEAAQAFEELKSYAAGAYPDLTLTLGAELRWGPQALEWLESGACPGLNGTSYVLVDFLENTPAEVILTAIRVCMNAGYRAVLAHAERYSAFHRDHRELHELIDLGAVIQLDAGSLFGEWGRAARIRARRLLSFYLADCVASDAHNTTDRAGSLAQADALITKLCGASYARTLLLDNPSAILHGAEIRKEQ